MYSSVHVYASNLHVCTCIMVVVYMYIQDTHHRLHYVCMHVKLYVHVASFVVCITNVIVYLYVYRHVHCVHVQDH